MESVSTDCGTDSCDDLEKEPYGMGSDSVPNQLLPEVHYNWVDVTDEFFIAVKDLELGELLHDESFGLFEAMSAIEMMDPKMDAGMLCNRGSKTALNFDQAVQTGALKLQDLTLAEQIGIIDCTLACLVSWLEGHSLAQTVFTNLYLHRPHQIGDRCIKAFSICVFKIVDIIKDFVNRQEEDFQSMVYGYRLVPDVSEPRALGMLKEVEDELHRRVRNSNKPSSASPHAEHEDVVALYSRIKFMRLLYQVLSTLPRREQPALADCQRLLASCSELLTSMQRTVGRGVQPHTDIMGFDPLVNQRLLPPTFPRYTKIKSRVEALDYFEELLNRLKLVCKITSQTSFHNALDFFIEFSRQGPCILSRSILQLLYLPLFNKVFGTLNFADVLKDAAKNFIFPPVLMPKSTLLLNPQAERVDAYLHNLSLKSDSPRPHLACFGTWILYHTLRIMIMYLLSGYLYEFLYGWLVSALSRADSFLTEQEAMAEIHKGRGTKKNKSKKKKTRPYGREITIYQALQNICGGFYKAMVGFRLDGKIKLPHPEFDNEQVRYEHRFAPFASLMTPPPVQYVEFRDMTSLLRYEQPPSSSNLYLAGCQNFHKARALLETINTPDQEVNDLLKVAKTNFVVLKILAGGHKKDSTVPPEFDFTSHHHFPIIKLGSQPIFNDIENSVIIAF
uniref:Protein MAK10 homolog n=1 Tax=Timema bartmani TaxID=61472 RepID=A0A7R9EYF9_9NEOP|nr:unnamed protein product [Timema bartmani]